MEHLSGGHGSRAVPHATDFTVSKLAFGAFSHIYLDTKTSNLAVHTYLSIDTSLALKLKHLREHKDLPSI